jgi:hypothetical protein
MAAAAAGKHMSPLDELVSTEEEADPDGERDECGGVHWGWLQDDRAVAPGAGKAPGVVPSPPWYR